MAAIASPAVAEVSGPPSAVAAKPRLLMLAAHEPNDDPRVDWVARTAAEQFEVTVLGLQDWTSARPDDELAGPYRILRCRRARSISRELAHELLAGGAARAAIAVKRLPLPLALLALLPLAAVEILVRFVWLLCRLVAMLLPRTTFGAMRLVRQLRVAASPAQPTAAAAPSTAAAAPAPGLLLRARMLVATLRHVLFTADAFWRASADAPKQAVVYCNDLDTALAGLLLRRRLGGKLIYDSHEYWPHSNVEALPLQVRLFSAFDRFVQRRADHVITISEPLAREMERAYGVGPIEVVPNAEPWAGQPVARVRQGDIARLAAGRASFMFQGNFAPQRGLEELVDAWAEVDQLRAALFLRGPENVWRRALAQRAQALGLLGRSVYVLPPVAVEDLVAGAAEADIGIIPYKPTLPAYRYACPNKLSQYLHAGVAILGSNIPYVAQQIEAGQVGVVYDSADRASIVAAVDRMAGDREALRQWQRNALTYGRETFNWQVQSEPLRRILSALSAAA
jgi:glycosyltransferase involved in cell wall biosynthesis